MHRSLKCPVACIPSRSNTWSPIPIRPKNGDLTHVDLAAGAVHRLLRQSAGGDILVFMPTEQDIRETCELVEANKPPGGPGYAAVLPV